jgi:hypothetical protein
MVQQLKFTAAVLTVKLVIVQLNRTIFVIC